MKSILADTSIWIDHFRSDNEQLRFFLQQERIVMHPFIIGELMMGSLADRNRVALGMGKLRPIPAVNDEQVRAMVENDRLFGRGIGYIDAHLLASVRRWGHSQLWTKDRRLGALAAEFGVTVVFEG